MTYGIRERMEQLASEMGEDIQTAFENAYEYQSKKLLPQQKRELIQLELEIQSTKDALF